MSRIILYAIILFFVILYLCSVNILLSDKYSNLLKRMGLSNYGFFIVSFLIMALILFATYVKFGPVIPSIIGLICFGFLNLFISKSALSKKA